LQGFKDRVYVPAFPITMPRSINEKLIAFTSVPDLQCL